MKQSFILILIALIILSCQSNLTSDKHASVCGISIDGTIYSENDFDIIDLPDRNNRLELNHSYFNIGVSYLNDRLFIHDSQDSKFETIVVTDGILQAIDNGEFGGGLQFIPFDSEKDSEEIFKGNISYIFRLSGKIYAFAGGGHIVENTKGWLLEIHENSNGYSVSKLLELESRPMAMMLFNEKIYVAGHNQFLIISGSKVETKFNCEFWSSLYPNSVAVAHQSQVFVGLRGGYVSIDLLRNKIVFHKKREAVYE